MSHRKLPKTAYELAEGQTFEPLTPAHEQPAEFTLKAIVAGAICGVMFGAANTFLGLKAGLTISTSIPVAVLSVVAFRILGAFGKRHSILEVNTSQTVGSASSSVASGVLFTLPALFLWNREGAALDIDLLQMTLLAMSGGLIGVLFMIPLRRFLIRREHGRLPYPEGMACAEVLVAAHSDQADAESVTPVKCPGPVIVIAGLLAVGSVGLLGLAFYASRVGVSAAPILVAEALIGLAVAVGLFLGQRWARVAYFVLGAIGILLAAMEDPGWAVVRGVVFAVAVVLLTRKSASSFFRTSGPTAKNTQAVPVFAGLAFGAFIQWITGGLRLFRDSFRVDLPARGGVEVEASAALTGVGYILGARISAVMAGGGALAALVIIPAIYLWGRGLEQPLYPETVRLIREMEAGAIWTRYVRYIGAGAVAAGGVLTLIRSIPTMVESFRVGVSQLGKDARQPERTDRDLSFGAVGAMLAIILLMLTFVPGVLGYIDSIVTRGIAALAIAVFAFFFVTVSSRIVGLVGVTSNPTSGMTIATLLGTSTLFYAFGWTGIEGKATALMVGTVVCIASSIAGDTSQDLKTGFVLGATPRRQQIGELVGVITSAVFVCLVVIALDNTYGLGSEDLPAPQATLMKLVIDGVLDQNLPWAFIGIGVAIGVVAALCRLPVLAFAVGVYLPLATMAPLFLGGVLRWFLTRNVEEAEGERRRERGVLFGSGLVGGAGLMGVGFAVWALARGGEKITGFPLGLPNWADQALAAATIGLILGAIAWTAKRRDA